MASLADLLSRALSSAGYQRSRRYTKAGNTSGGGAYGVQAAMAQRGISPASNRLRADREAGRIPQAPPPPPPPQAQLYPQYNGPQYSLEDYMGEANGYMASYRNNIAASRKQIEEQFQLAFSDATTREGISQGVVQQLPAQLEAIYGDASATLDKEGAETLAVQEGHNLISHEAAGAGSEGQKASMTAAWASRKADVPMLAAGVTSQINRQKGALGQAKFERFGDLDRAAAEMEIQFTKEQGEARRQYMMAQEQRRWSIEDRNFGAEQEARMARENQPVDNFERDRAAAKEDEQDAWKRDQDARAEEEQALALEKLRGYSGGNVSKDRARAMQAGNRKEFNRISNSYNMRQAEEQLRGGLGGDKFGRFRFTPTAKQIAESLEDRQLFRAASVFRLRNM